jgi:hypothetical protein
MKIPGQLSAVINMILLSHHPNPLRFMNAKRSGSAVMSSWEKMRGFFLHRA